MTTNEEIFDSPKGWVRSHIEEYVATDGRKGHKWRGLPTLLLTTRGRKSGKLPKYLLVASNGGHRS
ncbi:MAG: nitroreductase family deazaflavin-dependent oxidoreductase [Chloroflexi bacterium]|nr:nitroreductase family deazaflavin-dependent oxidoreductase [Ardenticatenaceae bacterium]MBL1129950.1 DUF385 domain-containing protein [Chloroflexota bacterium]NOG36036.1 nitroreductase family deazaflavin-dependent oxidoreductase [Chloroflexota bacterium]GIK56485.1 MAG: hypothetical protein BroJett015_21480 [Chloroflexota bacterium]